MRTIDSTTTFLDLSVVVDDARIACRHHEQQSPPDRPRLPQYPLHGSFARPNARSRLSGVMQDRLHRQARVAYVKVAEYQRRGLQQRRAYRQEQDGAPASLRER